MKIGLFWFSKTIKKSWSNAFYRFKISEKLMILWKFKDNFPSKLLYIFQTFFLKTLNCSGSSFSSWAPICLINLFCLALDRIKIFIFKIIHFLSKLLTENQASIPILNENQAVSQFMNEYQAVSNLL